MLQNNNGPPLVGQVTIACHLVKEAKRPELLGNCAESRAVVQQWLEHRVTNLDGYKKEDIKAILKVAMLIFKEKTFKTCSSQLLLHCVVRLQSVCADIAPHLNAIDSIPTQN